MSATVASDAVYDAFLGQDLGARTFYHGHSFAGNALAAAVALEHLRLIESDDVLANVVARAAQLEALLARDVAPLPGVAAVRQRGLMVGVELRPPGPGPALGPARLRRGRPPRRPPASPRRRRRRHAPPHHHRRRDRTDRLDPGRGHRRGRPPWTDDVISARERIPARRDRAVSTWSARVEAAQRRLRGRGPLAPALSPSTPVDPRASSPPTAPRWWPSPPTTTWASRSIRRWWRPPTRPSTSGARARAPAASSPAAGPATKIWKQALAEWKGTERAVVFPTGFAANLGVLTRLRRHRRPHLLRRAQPRLDHRRGPAVAAPRSPSTATATSTTSRRFLTAAPGPALVVTDVVFSMDGDVAPVDGDRRRSAAATGALLVLDEAHAVLGPDLGPDLAGVDVLRVGTLSKTLGSLGGFVAGARPFIELLENRARSYIFTTAPTPPDAAAALRRRSAILLLPGGRRSAGRAGRPRRARGPRPPESHHPRRPRPDERAVAASAALRDHGVWVPAIRPAHGATGTARLRVTLSAAHTEDHVALLLEALAAGASVTLPA